MLIAGGVAPNRRYRSREDILVACAEFGIANGRALRTDDLRADNGHRDAGFTTRPRRPYDAFCDGV